MKRFLLSLLVCLVAACTNVQAEDAVRIHVDNATDTPIGLYVNDDWIGTDEPGARIVSPLGDHGGPPYRIEARSPSGAVLAAVEVPAGPVEALREGRGTPVGEEVGVPCGVIRIVVGELGPDQSLAPAAPVAPGPCP